MGKKPYTRPTMTGIDCQPPRMLAASGYDTLSVGNEVTEAEAETRRRTDRYGYDSNWGLEEAVFEVKPPEKSPWDDYELPE